VHGLGRCGLRDVTRGLAALTAVFVLADAAGSAFAQSSPIVQLTVTRSRSVVRVGSTSTLQAFATLADGTTGVDVTSSVSWSASAPGIVALTGNQATGIASGQVDVTATDLASGIQSNPTAGTLRVVANLASIRVTPTKRVLPIKRSTRYRAIGAFEGGIELDITGDCDLSLSQPIVGTLEASGRFRAANPGTSAVRAVDRATGVAAGTTGGNGQVEVVGKLAALTVTPASLAVPVGGSTALKAKANFVGYCQQYTYTRRIAWSSSDPSVATVDREGLVSCLTDGTVTISVRDRGGSVNSSTSSGDARIVCGGQLLAIRVSPERWTVAVGEERELRALYVFAGGITVDGTRNVVWSTSDPSIIAIGRDGDAGSGQGLAPGEATVSAFDPARNVSSSDAGGKDGTLVVPSSLLALSLQPGGGSSLQPGGASGALTGLVGTTVKFNASATYSAGPSRAVNKLSTWSTSDPAVVGLDDGSPCYVAGTATLLAEGTSTVSATYPSSGGAFTPQTAAVVVTVVTPAPPPSPTPTPPGSASRAFLDRSATLLD
jgi:hypothetical protein